MRDFRKMMIDRELPELSAEEREHRIMMYAARVEEYRLPFTGEYIQNWQATIEGEEQ